MDTPKTLAAPRNRIWFDTEFIEDGKTIELVSIGLVAEDGRTYYAEVEGVDYSRADPWLHANVFPHLTGEMKPREQIAAEVRAFAGERPEFWAYYADYDWVALCQLYGRMIDLPAGWPMYCRDVKQLADAAGNPKLPEQTTTEHHALADAIDTKAKWEFLAEALRSASNSGAEAMREAVKAAFPDEPPGRLRLEPEEVRAIVLALSLPAPGAPASPWRGMESAPKTGERILATGGGLGRQVEVVTWNERIGCWNAETCTLEDHDSDPDGYNRPTLWQPLPTPPASKDT